MREDHSTNTEGKGSCCACADRDSVQCAAIRYGMDHWGEPCECICHQADDHDDTYPSTERDDWTCDCGRTYADASQELANDTSCVYCGSDNWTPPSAAQAEPGGANG